MNKDNSVQVGALMGAQSDRLHAPSQYYPGHTGKDLLDRAVLAHGGLAVWSAVRALRVRLRARFPLLMIKGIAPVLRHFQAEVDTQCIHVRLDDYPRPGLTGHYAGMHVWINRGDELVCERHFQPAPGRRAPFSYWWDDLDFLFFLGYALWNYKCTPFLFLQQGFTVKALTPVRASAWRRSREWLYPLRVQYPAEIPTHSAEQTFYYDETGLLQRLDYRADVIGRAALGVHLCTEHRDFGGLIYPTYRQVLGGWIPRFPPPYPKAVQAWIEEVVPVHV